MADDDDLYFSFDEEEEEPAEAEVVEAEESRNRSFLIGAIILAAVFVVGIAAILLYFLFGRGPQQPAVSANELTNQANMTLFAITQTAAFEATPEPLATVTVEPQAEEEEASPAPTASPVPEEATEVVEEPTQAGTKVAEVTAMPGAAETARPTPLAEEPTAQATSGLIEVTPLGGEGTVTLEAATPVPGAAGTLIATATGLPETGFAGTVGLAGAGLLALVLVAIVVVVRRIRLQ